MGTLGIAWTHGILRTLQSAAILAVACLALVPKDIFAQSPIIAVSKESYFETLQSSRQVSVTGRLVGFQSFSGQLNVRRPIVSVSGLKSSDKTICIDISHVSGVYLGRARVANPGLSGVVSFRLPAELMSRASSDPKEYAVLVRASTSSVCHQRNDVLLSGWGARPPAGKAVVAISASEDSSLRLAVEGASARPACVSAAKFMGSNTVTFQRFSRVCIVEPTADCLRVARFELVIEESGTRVPTRRRTLRRTCARN